LNGDKFARGGDSAKKAWGSKRPVSMQKENVFIIGGREQKRKAINSKKVVWNG